MGCQSPFLLLRLCYGYLTPKDISAGLRAQLEREVAANFRSVGQEAMARLQRTFDLDAGPNAPVVDRLIEEAIKAGRSDFDEGSF